MDDNDDAGYIRMPTKLFVSSIGSVALVAWFYGAIRPAPDQQQLATLENDLSENSRLNFARSTKDHAEFRESAMAGGEAIVTFSQQSEQSPAHPRQHDPRWTSAQQDKYQREQVARDESQERRLMLLERDVDKLGGMQ